MKKLILMTALMFAMHPLIKEFLGDFVYANEIFVQSYERSNGQHVNGYIRQAPAPQYQWNKQDTHKALDYNYRPPVSNDKRMGGSYGFPTHDLD